MVAPLILGGGYVPNALNIDAIKRTVKSTPWMVFLGDLGDDRHQQGSGDHTTHSTHTGKYGYPTQGVVHAIDTGMTNINLDLAETFIRRSWRRGELTGIKYFNVLNRHWNTQTWDNYNKAKTGTLQPRYSPDHHLHLSMENGAIDGDILDRFKTWLDNGQSFEEEDVPSPVIIQRIIPVGFAYKGKVNDPGNDEILNLKNALQIVTPPVNGGALNYGAGWLSFGVDHGQVLLRIAISAGKSYGIIIHKHIRSEMAREETTVNLPTNCGRITIGRVDTQGVGLQPSHPDAPTAALIEIAVKK